MLLAPMDRMEWISLAGSLGPQKRHRVGLKVEEGSREHYPMKEVSGHFEVSEGSEQIPGEV